MSDKIVLRFAPSPTGPLHIGGVRTALYNYLLAKKTGGRFILRIEDTDQNRYVEGAEEYIIQALRWVGIEFNEGVGAGGEKGPYRQSERKSMYRQFADQLIASDNAYYAFDTPEELDAMREELKAAGSSNLQYNFAVRGRMKNSLSLSKEEVAERLASGDPYVIRMKMPRKEEIRFHDMIRKWVVFQSNQLDDKILLKGDGMPTYHLANVVDDYHMGVTHVIRGEEWVSSTPLHVMLYRSLGWENSMPVFIHLPLILNPNGKGKMSKRQGDKLGFSVFPTQWKDPKTGDTSSGFREDGYLPEALMNFLALLGWNPGNEEELMEEDRLVELFDLEKLNNSATNFNIEKLNWFNQQYIRMKTEEELLVLVKPELEAAGYRIPSDSFLLEVIRLLKERVTLLTDFIGQSKLFFEAPTSFNEKMKKKHWKGEARDLMAAMKDKFSAIKDWKAENLKNAFEELLVEKEVGKGKILAPLRLVLTGEPSGPGAFDIAAVIGREETQSRMAHAIEHLA
ncbi:MAG: glutamate--tRNA ligase [Bacteroidota bacterium]